MEMGLFHFIKAGLKFRSEKQKVGFPTTLLREWPLYSESGYRKKKQDVKIQDAYNRESDEVGVDLTSKLSLRKYNYTDI